MVAGVATPALVEALAMFREAMKHQGEQHYIGNNVTEADRVTGTSKAYTLPSLAASSAHPLAAGWK